MNMIVKTDAGYEVYVLIQDGTECVGTYKTEQRARAEWVKGQKVLNNSVCKKTAVSIYEFQPVVRTELVRTK